MAILGEAERKRVSNALSLAHSFENLNGNYRETMSRGNVITLKRVKDFFNSRGIAVGDDNSFKIFDFNFQISLHANLKDRNTTGLLSVNNVVKEGNILKEKNVFNLKFNQNGVVLPWNDNYETILLGEIIQFIGDNDRTT